MSMDLFKELWFCPRGGEYLSPGLLRTLLPKRLIDKAQRFVCVNLTPTYIKVLRDIVVMAENLESLSLSGCTGLSEARPREGRNTNHYDTFDGEHY
jgi:hypothetical protein